VLPSRPKLSDSVIGSKRTKFSVHTTAPEHLALHLRDHQLQVLDQRLSAGERGAHFDQYRLERIYVVGELIQPWVKPGNDNRFNMTGNRCSSPRPLKGQYADQYGVADGPKR
jgi:hypothetical protein